MPTVAMLLAIVILAMRGVGGGTMLLAVADGPCEDALTIL